MTTTRSARLTKLYNIVKKYIPDATVAFYCVTGNQFLEMAIYDNKEETLMSDVRVVMKSLFATRIDRNRVTYVASRLLIADVPHTHFNEGRFNGITATIGNVLTADDDPMDFKLNIGVAPKVYEPCFNAEAGIMLFGKPLYD